jgi:hypothetical protein
MTREDRIEHLLISVKTRNKYETVHDPVTGKDGLKCDKHGKPKLNKKYNILKPAQMQAKRLESVHQARAAWVAVQIDPKSNRYSCYFGYLDDRICTRNGIDMCAEDIAGYLCLGQDITPDIGISHLDNVE